MVTSEKDYKELLYVLNDPNVLPGDQIYYRIPSDEPVYKIDLNTREVQVPEFLSVLEDHNSEVIWFKVDRFYDDYDLYGATCWIQYRNALKEEYIAYTTPKVIDDNDHNTLYLPWPISGPVAKAAGNVTFSFQFFKLSEDKKRVYYSIHTKPATGKILHGLHVNPVEFIVGGDGKVKDENDFPTNPWEDPSLNPQQAQLLKDFHILTEAYERLVGDYNLYWIDDED